MFLYRDDNDMLKGKMEKKNIVLYLKAQVLNEL